MTPGARKPQPLLAFASYSAKRGEPGGGALPSATTLDRFIQASPECRLTDAQGNLVPAASGKFGCDEFPFRKTVQGKFLLQQGRLGGDYSSLKLTDAITGIRDEVSNQGVDLRQFIRTCPIVTGDSYIVIPQALEGDAPTQPSGDFSYWICETIE